jgi:TolB-like protein
MRIFSKPLAKKSLMTVLYITILPMSGCAVVSDYLKDSLKNNAQENLPSVVNDTNGFILDLPIEDDLTAFHTHKKVNDYTSRLAHDLVKNINPKDLNTPVAVASFVHFDNLKSSSKLGNLISESLMGQLQNQAIQTVDIHMMDAIQTTDKGAFVFNRQIADYFQSQSIDYVLSGTMVQDQHGLTINARIVQFGNRQIISSATTLIPYFVADIYD